MSAEGHDSKDAAVIDRRYSPIFSQLRRLAPTGSTLWVKPRAAAVRSYQFRLWLSTHYGLSVTKAMGKGTC
jgi:hypothetical protein